MTGGMIDLAKSDLESYKLGNSRLDVFHRDDHAGDGWSMAFFVNDKELMRFDLFEPMHEHWNLLDSPKMFYPPMEFSKAVDIATANLVVHYKMISRLAGVSCEATKDEVLKASEWAKNLLLVGQAQKPQVRKPVRTTSEVFAPQKLSLAATLKKRLKGPLRSLKRLFA